MGYHIITRRGLISFAKIVLTLYDSLGNSSKVIMTIEKNPNSFRDLLLQNKTEIILSDFSWNSTIFKNLNFTEFQEVVLKVILLKKNKMTLYELEEEIKKSNFDIKNGSSIGGCIAGITKKCNTRKIPSKLLRSKNYKYSIDEQAIVPLKRYFNIA